MITFKPSYPGGEEGGGGWVGDVFSTSGPIRKVLGVGVMVPSGKGGGRWWISSSLCQTNSKERLNAMSSRIITLIGKYMLQNVPYLFFHHANGEYLFYILYE